MNLQQKLKIALFISITTLIGGCGGGSSRDETPGPIAECSSLNAVGEFVLTAPTNGAVLFQTRKLVVFTGESLNITIDRVEYWADNKSTLLGSSNSTPFSVNFDTTRLPNGDHTLQAIAFDSCNNAITSQVVPVVSYADSFKDANEFHVSPTGSAAGDGSIDAPWDATTMFSSAAILPGDIIWVHGGNYDNAEETLVYKTYLKGTRERPIIIRAYGDGPVDIHINDAVLSASWNWFWGFEPHIERPERSVPDTGYRRPSAFYLTTEGHRIINNIIYDNGHPGIGSWKGVGDGEIYGSLIWGTGIYDFSPVIRGSAIYTQNELGTRTIKDVISFRNFTNGIKPYTENSFVNGFHIEGNISFKNAQSPFHIQGVNNPIQGLKLINNYTFQESAEGGHAVVVGYSSADQINNNIEISGNYFVAGYNPAGAITSAQIDHYIFSDNTIITKYVDDINSYETPRLFTYYPTTTQENIYWDNNHYYGGRGVNLSADNLINNYSDRTTYDAFRSLEQWQSARSPFDSNSTWTQSYPADNTIVVRPNVYERGRGHIIIYNWQGLANVTVDISTLGLDEGEMFEIRDAQNYYGTPIITAQYSHAHSSVELPMNLTEISPTVGTITHMDSSLTHTSDQFAVFVVLRK
ncbi:MAG: Ig-like domain-containing protein [Candidatus Polarisedimenticolaceae bacterium]|nr:Ig-like domain-containing protein [Candidatus Polarisedimenticolaceae bacterium]